MAVKNLPGGGILGRRAGTVKPFVWQPAKIGPSFEWLDHDTIRVLEGGLAGKILGVKTELLRYSATVSLYDGKNQIGIVSIERDPPGQGVILWDAGVKEAYRRNGLSAIMTWIIFRELLSVQDRATFRIRMVRSVKSGDNGAELQNVGMGVIALRLGFTPELNLAQVIRGDNIADLAVLLGTKDSPPALKITLRRDPFVLILFVVNPDTMKPTNNLRIYTEFKHDDSIIQEWAKQGLVAVNGNYVLKEERIDYFVNRIAVDEEEAIVFRSKIRGL